MPIPNKIAMRDGRVVDGGGLENRPPPFFFSAVFHANL
jgi:hypothetical protein